MPTVLQEKGYRFFFYAADRYEPAHVHVAKDGGVGKIWLEPALSVKYLYKFKEQEKREIVALVNHHYEYLINKWYEYFSQ